MSEKRNTENTDKQGMLATGIRYGADAPVSDPKEDAFQRWPFAQRVARTIAESSDPSSLVVGIYGAWGEGKSSVLNFVAQALVSFPNVVCVKFDPWRYGDEAQLLENFFATLAAALDRKLSKRHKRVAAAIGEYAAPLIPSVGVGPVRLDVAKSIERAAKNLAAQGVEDERVLIERILEAESKRVIVLMDDIDRLDKQDVRLIFKLVKLTASFKHTSYVLAFDEALAAGALAADYAGGDEGAGHAFLEKIIQVPLHIPAVQPRLLDDFCFSALADILQRNSIELTQLQVDEFRWQFDQGIRRKLTTPRAAVRYANALAFVMPMLRGEVNPVDVMLMEGMRVFYPGIYELVRSNPSMVLQETASLVWHFSDQGKQARETLDSALGVMPSHEVEGVRSLLIALFPNLRSHWTKTASASGPASVWANHQRVAHPDYFRRYFSYGVPEGDIPDMQITEIVERLDVDPPEQLASRMKELVSDRSPDQLVDRLSQLPEAGLVDSALRNLALALAAVGPAFPRTGKSFTALHPQARTAALIADLLYAIRAETERDPATLAVVEAVEPVSFLAEFIYQEPAILERVRQRESVGTSTPSPSLTEIPGLRDIVSRRIRTFAESSPEEFLRRTTPAYVLLTAWKKCQVGNEIQRYLQRALEELPETAAHFLLHFVPENVATGAPALPMHGFAEVYEAIGLFTDPSIVATALKAHLDSHPNGALVGSAIPVEEAIARGFLDYHASQSHTDGSPAEPAQPS